MHIRLPGVLEAQTAHRYEILDAEPHQSQSIKSVPRRAAPTRAPHSHWLCCEWMQYICCDNTFASPIVPLRTTWKNARRSSWDPRLPILGTAPGPSRQHGAAVARTHREGRHGACEHRPERERENKKSGREREPWKGRARQGEPALSRREAPLWMTSPHPNGFRPHAGKPRERTGSGPQRATPRPSPARPSRLTPSPVREHGPSPGRRRGGGAPCCGRLHASLCQVGAACREGLRPRRRRRPAQRTSQAPRIQACGQESQQQTNCASRIAAVGRDTLVFLAHREGHA